MGEQRKALMLASVASMIDQFNMSNIELLQSLGYHVDVVADFTNPGNISNERAATLINQLKSMNVHVVDVAIPRALNPRAVASAYKKVKNLIRNEHYNLIHCHSPIGGAITRLAARNERKHGTTVIYTAHGFHFYTGAPLKNWIVFYPVEKICARWTDILITINKEDFERARRKFKIKNIKYVPGIGVDIKKFSDEPMDKKEKRKELGIPQQALVLLSVGELNTNKNHQVVIKALGQIGDNNIYYVIAGKGERGDELKELARALDIQNQLHLIGYRSDIPSLYKMADIYVLPSIREGLNVSLMEAMASGLPCVVSRIRGNVDLISDEDYCIDSSSVNGFVKAISDMKKQDMNKIGAKNYEVIKGFSKSKVMKYMRDIYSAVR